MPATPRITPNTFHAAPHAPARRARYHILMTGIGRGVDVARTNARDAAPPCKDLLELVHIRAREADAFVQSKSPFHHAARGPPPP